MKFDLLNKGRQLYVFINFSTTEAPVGTTVVQVSAFDLDRSSSLRYNIVSGSFSAKDPFDRDVIGTSAFDFRVSQYTGKVHISCLLNDV